MNIEQLQELLKRYRIKPNKTFGQNFLLNDIVLRDIVDSVPISKKDSLLEVGPGIGNLTAQLIATGLPVLSVEKDETFLPILKDLKKNHDNFEFAIDDILHFNFQEALAGHDYHVVANIPYYITGKIIQIFVRSTHKPKTITILVQKEVAKNLTSSSGNLNLLALSVQLYGDAKLVQTVLARDFYPAPKVDSAVVQISLYDKPRYIISDEKKFFSLLRACFSGKRKQLHNTLSQYIQGDKKRALDLLASVNIDSHVRPQEVSLDQWIKLYEALQK
jgi:16S rRNA (adenine1518-N6/adenine1519-N6)-dimethyltransferase